MRGRLAKVSLGGGGIMRLLQAAVDGIPGDARLIAANYDPQSQQFTLILESRRFPETDMRRGIPEWPVSIGYEEFLGGISNVSRSLARGLNDDERARGV